MQKIITFIITIFLVALILIGLGKQIASAIQSSKRLDSEADQVNKLQIQNRQLKDRLAEVQKYDFIEQTARDKLDLSQPGDTVIVVPPEAVSKALEADKPIPEVKTSNWDGWMHLFFRNS